MIGIHREKENEMITPGVLTVFDALLALRDEFVVGANVQDVDQHFRHYLNQRKNK
jgi:hypothetical protein